MADEAGTVRYGETPDVPLFEFHASKFKTGRSISPNVIQVWSDRVEEHEGHTIAKSGTQTIGFSEVAQIAVSEGWCRATSPSKVPAVTESHCQVCPTTMP